jgi:hypothetical protein
VRVPDEFADLLTPRGRRVLEGRLLAGVLKSGRRFIAERGLLDAAKSRAVLAMLERDFAPRLKAMEAPIPPESIWGMKRNYSELLPKTARVRTVYSGAPRFLRSQTFRQFVEALSGRRVRARWGTQVLAYGAGDYAGPHNDHHPEDAEARDGYTDVHLSFCARGRQTLVYAPLEHFTEQAEVATLGGVTAYRLPFWHFTTPLRGTRRWVLLGTFLDAR